MKMHVRVTAAALILMGLATGCQKTTEGSVAMTTEPGPPLSSPTRTAPSLPSLPELPNLPNFPIPEIQIPGLPNTNVPEVPAPPNATTMTCGEYNDLDEATKLAVVRAIVSQDDNPRAADDEMVGLLLANTMCQFMPDAVVNEVVLSGLPG